jgi:hypothetical protein
MMETQAQLMLGGDANTQNTATGQLGRVLLNYNKKLLNGYL